MPQRKDVRLATVSAKVTLSHSAQGLVARTADMVVLVFHSVTKHARAFRSLTSPQRKLSTKGLQEAVLLSARLSEAPAVDLFGLQRPTLLRLTAQKLQLLDNQVVLRQV